MLYKVKATYKYQAEDMDELAFEVGEIIDVIEYEDPEEQVRQQDIWTQRYGDIIIQCCRRRGGLWESRIQQDKRVSSRPTSQSLFKMLKFLKSNCTCSLFAAGTLCLANFFKLDWDDKIFNRNYASDLNELCFLLLKIIAH